MFIILFVKGIVFGNLLVSKCVDYKITLNNKRINELRCLWLCLFISKGLLRTKTISVFVIFNNKFFINDKDCYKNVSERKKPTSLDVVKKEI